MTRAQELAEYLLQAFDRHGCSIDQIFTAVLEQFGDKLKYHLQALTHAEPILESHSVGITEKIDEFKKLVYDIDQFAQDIKPALWLTYFSKSAKGKSQHCNDLQLLYAELQPLLHFMSVISRLMKDKVITPTLSERLCALLQQQQAIDRKTTALQNKQSHPELNLYSSSKSQPNKLTYVTKNSPSLANHLVATRKELKFFCEKKDGNIVQAKHNTPSPAQENQPNTSQFKL